MDLPPCYEENENAKDFFLPLPNYNDIQNIERVRYTLPPLSACGFIQKEGPPVTFRNGKPKDPDFLNNNNFNLREIRVTQPEKPQKIAQPNRKDLDLLIYKAEMPETSLQQNNKTEPSFLRAIFKFFSSWSSRRRRFYYS
jgi:hypothetical protein